MKVEQVKYSPSKDFRVIGISAQECDYKMAWELIAPMGMQFYLLSDFVVEKPNQQQLGQFEFDFSQNSSSSFTIYGNYEDSFKKSTLLLVSNKLGPNCLIDELSNFDYLLLVHTNCMFSDEDILERLRSINFVSGAYVLPIDNIKSKYNIYNLWDSLQNRQ